MKVECSAEAIRTQLADTLTRLGHAIAPQALGDRVVLGELGVDSFQLTEFARQLEVHYGRQLDMASWVLQEMAGAAPAFTVASLIRHVQARVSTGA